MLFLTEKYKISFKCLHLADFPALQMSDFRLSLEDSISKLLLPTAKNEDQEGPEECIYNSDGLDFNTGILDAICSKIANNNNELEDTDIQLLIKMFGPTLNKAADLIDRKCVELITITNTTRAYFSVQGNKGFYTLYPRLNFCQCFIFESQVLRKCQFVICKHILACHLALAMKKYQTRNIVDFIYSFS